jgi:hypothetical protein
MRRSVASLSQSPADLGACAYRPVSPEKRENRGNRRLERRCPNDWRFHFCCFSRVAMRWSVAVLSRSPADLGAGAYRPVSPEKRENRGNRRLERRCPNAGRLMVPFLLEPSQVDGSIFTGTVAIRFHFCWKPHCDGSIFFAAIHVSRSGGALPPCAEALRI